ncbi:hypothetical protein Q1695_010185 [Nippostrongylus brasiliensis]|nr:hypothetical protein Q1695_010185 [Nippostrongylus brasiliensis]
MSPKAFVDELIASNKVVVFSKSYCPFCHKAKAALDTQNLKPGVLQWLEIEKLKDCQEIQDYLLSITGGRTVPRVFINQKFFGGGNEAEAAVKDGKLAELLKEAGAI